MRGKDVVRVVFYLQLKLQFAVLDLHLDLTCHGGHYGGNLLAAVQVRLGLYVIVIIVVTPSQGIAVSQMCGDGAWFDRDSVGVTRVVRRNVTQDDYVARVTKETFHKGLNIERVDNAVVVCVTRARATRLGVVEEDCYERLNIELVDNAVAVRVARLARLAPPGVGTRRR